MHIKCITAAADGGRLCFERVLHAACAGMAAADDLAALGALRGRLVPHCAQASDAAAGQELWTETLRLLGLQEGDLALN